MFLRRIFVPIVISTLLPLYCIGQNDDAKVDTTNKAGRITGKPKPYKEIITAKAITDDGLFKVHKVDNRYYFEIPDSLIGRDILTVNRISKAAADVRPRNGFYGYAGDEIGENVIQFSKGPNNKIFIQRISYAERSNDSTENGMYRSVVNSNFQPIVSSFDIKAFSPDSSGAVIDITDYINGDNNILFFDSQVKKAFELGAIQADKSYISKISSYPENIEVKTVKTYLGTDNSTKTYELNCSIVLLPKIPMKARMYDKRVGYFSSDYKDFDINNQGVEITRMITRWRLEPKDGEVEKYMRGELVEPKKPIVFYIDPATPKKWVPYLIQGVNDWQKAFEKAGFKNAIYALEAPANDSTWSLEDARHSAIIYKPSAVANAYGPNVQDPRTGEILEAHVQWFHNVMNLLHDWYMVQASTIDPKARRMIFDDSLMGQLIRFVSSHEVGHTLGLAHNFGSSSTIPVDSLRNKRYVETNGHTPSIMDYARFNYVAQPEDGISEKGIFPRVGIYDEWAIEWGYRCLDTFTTKQEEETYLNHWIITAFKKDHRLWYGPQPRNAFGIAEDPRCQSEDLGDDAMKASSYGIKNLERIQEKLIEWTKETNGDYTSLRNMQQNIGLQYYRYILHVASNIGKYYFTSRTVEEEGNLVEFIPRGKQKQAVEFLGKYLFQPPLWLLNKEIFAKGAGYDETFIRQIQSNILFLIFYTGAYSNLTNFKNLYPKEAYTYDDLLYDLEKEIWSELNLKTPINIYRRNLQKVYIEILVSLNDITNPGKDPMLEQINNSKKTSDLLPILQYHLKLLRQRIQAVLPAYKDVESKQHLVTLSNRLQQALDPNSLLYSTEGRPSKSLFGIVLSEKEEEDLLLSIFGNQGKKKVNTQYFNCWENIMPSFIQINR